MGIIQNKKKIINNAKLIYNKNGKVYKKDFIKLAKQKKLFCIESVIKYFGNLDSLEKEANIKFKRKKFLTKEKIIKCAKIIFNKQKNNINFKRTEFYNELKEKFNIPYKAIYVRFGRLDNLAKLCNYKFNQETGKQRLKSKFTKKDIKNSFKKLIEKEKILKKTDIQKFYKNNEFICHTTTIRSYFKNLEELADSCNFQFLKVNNIGFLGKNEIKILDFYEKINNVNIDRDFYIGNFKPDGVIHSLKQFVEVDELYHKWQKDKDRIREEKIKRLTGYDFVRLDEQEWLRKLEIGSEN